MFDKKKMDSMIENSKNILISSHHGPDPDSISSALSMLWYINEYYPKKKAEVVIEAIPPESMKIIPNFEKIKFVDDLSTQFEAVDLAIFLDGNSIGRFSKQSDEIDQSNFQTICIDHHRSEGGDFDLTHIDPTAAAAAQIIAEEIVSNDIKDTTLSKILLFGIAADTGTFRFTVPENARVLSTTEKILQSSGLNMQEIDLSLTMITEKKFEVYQELIKNTKNVKLKNHPFGITYTYISKDFLDKGYDKNIISGAQEIFNHSVIRKIEGYPWGFMVTPREVGEFRLSFRSTPNSPKVRPIAEAFDGGGHDMAAGGSYKDETSKIDSEEITTIVLDKIESMDLELVDV